MACGDRYRHLVRTVSGFTPEHPFGTGLDAEIKGPGDYLEWYKLADHLVAQAYRAFVRLGDCECKATGGTNCGTADWQGGSFPKWNALVDRNNALFTAWDDLPYPFLQISPAFDVTRAVQVCLDAVCLLDLANEGIEGYGCAADPVSGLGGGGDGGGLALIGLAVAAYFIIKRGRARKAAAKEAA